ncbi:hypothetical protein EV368DRAFT_77621 [Lentinula lateritia]|nr:hypothetical protein EV368DRAFT_77621 [Lentinula lateritia]
MFFRIKGQFERLNPTRYQAIQSRLNNSVLDISGLIRDPRLPLMGFAPAYYYTIEGPLICVSSGKKIAGLLAPSLAIIDPFTTHAVEAMQAMEKDLPILTWWTASAGGTPSLVRSFRADVKWQTHQ